MKKVIALKKKQAKLVLLTYECSQHEDQNLLCI